MTTEVLRRLFTVEQYHRMIETGIIQEGDWVELIRGEIVEMASIGTKHAAGVNRSLQTFMRGQTIALLAFPGVPISVDEILG